MLVGRASERARIEALLARGRAGTSGVLVVRGEAGIGKSALLEHAASAAAGALLLRARGVETELELAFAGLHALLRPVLAAVDRLPAPQAAALRSALGLASGPATERHLVGAATLGVLAATAETQPVVVLVDDAQWLDGPSASALLFAARRLLADAVTILAAVREGEPSPFDGAGLDELALGGLPPDAARELLAGRAGRPIAADTAAWLHAATGGNPLALTELAGEAPRLRPGPVDDHVAVGARIAHALGRRLDAAGAEAGLLAAAVADDDALAPILAAAEALGSSLAELERAEAAGLLALEPGRAAFSHPLVRSAVLARATAADRRRAHRAFAAALQAASADGDRIVWHAAAGALAPDEAIAAGLAATGERAAARSGHAAAASAFERAARLTPHPERRARRMRRAAESAWLAGDGPRALALLGDAPGDAAAAHLRGLVLLHRGPVAEGIRVLHDAASACAGADPARAAEMLAEAAYAAVYTGSAELDALARRALELAPPDARRARCLALAAHGAALVIRGDAAAAAALEEAEALMRATPALRDDVAVAVWLGVAPAFLRAGIEDYEPLAEAIALARARGAVGVLPIALFFLGVGQFSAGRWPQAAASLGEAARLAQEAGLTVDATAAQAAIARLQARRGDAAPAADALARARAARLPFFEAWALQAQGEAALAAGDAAVALERLRAKRALLAERGLVDPDLSPDPEIAETLVRLGRDAEAAEAARRALAEAKVKGRPWALARAHRAVALTGDDALADFDAALALHAETPDGFEAARTRLCLGERLRRAGRRSDAREPLRASLAGFDVLGAAPWSARAAAELQATGESVRRRDPATLDELTPQELRVATMLARGATTREAGAALYLSPKTVEYHLGHVYRKLGINSRAALAEALATGGPPAPG